ncbi:SMP-30/gluconolactonase/LRE family protein [Nocardioides pyridinolyticus]
MTRLATGFSFVEGPVWHADEGRLVFSDIPADCMYVMSPDGAVEIFRAPSRMANGSTLDREGRLLTCEHATSRLVRRNLDGTLTVVADRFEGKELNSPNDVIVARDGTIYFTDPLYGRGSMYGVLRDPELDWRGVYRISPDGDRIDLVAADFDGPNGLCLSPDERFLYVNDTERRHIRRFAVDRGEIRGGEVWAEVTGEGVGVPDGMKCDRLGNLYCTGPGGIHVFDDEARAVGLIRVPEDTANFTWGDEDLRTLYICASTSIYCIRTAIPGLRLHLPADARST